MDNFVWIFELNLYSPMDWCVPSSMLSGLVCPRLSLIMGESMFWIVIFFFFLQNVWSRNSNKKLGLHVKLFYKRLCCWKWVLVKWVIEKNGTQRGTMSFLYIIYIKKYVLARLGNLSNILSLAIHEISPTLLYACVSILYIEWIEWEKKQHFFVLKLSLYRNGR